MRAPQRICVVIGTRPEVIKCWPVVRRLAQDSRFDVQVVLTGQHRELVDPLVRQLGLPVAFDLDVMIHRQSLEALTARLCERLGGAFAAMRPDVVLVQGDTTSAFVAALAAFYADIDVAHIEAGLRTRDIRNPFPEEMNRRLISTLARTHFAPTLDARSALLGEGVSNGEIHVTGNTGIDALRLMSESLHRFPAGAPLSAALERSRGPIIAVTLHRRENQPRLRAVALALAELTRRHSDLHLIFPIHLSPAVRDAVAPVLEHVPQCDLLDPLDYADFVRLLTRCRFVITDSGGVQEEAPFLGKPVLIVRRTTERPEVVRVGVAKLIGDDPRDIIDAASRLLTDAAVYDRMARCVCPYGDGHAAERIAAILSGQPGLVAEQSLDAGAVQTPFHPPNQHHGAGSSVASLSALS